ncbi:uncharacterized protein NPIL_677921 [Nephila pilipes]|uniref:Ig-like domain-containing protein n=1 Tax=Nephila pilipes TaxID=299642 RepID=A0A8X6PK60_NEPPI|nr:uncharacterized protein NPIL_677921 [Nephila pilipes]
MPLHVSWIRQRDLRILTMGTNTYTTDQRFQLIRTDDVEDWNLQIRDSRESDSGVYECQVSTEPKLSLAVQLNIITAKSYILEGPIVFIDIGSPVNLTCEVQDVVGTLFLFWDHNGTVLTKEKMYDRAIEYFMVLGTYSKSRLFIAEAKFSDAGIYSCHPSYANPTSITLHIVNGDEPAAMQPGGQNNEVANAALILVLALLIFVLKM